MKLVWFRNDLRIADNTALFQARQSGEPVAGLFLLAPAQWRQHHMSGVQCRYILRSLASLRDDLSTRGIPLVVRYADSFVEAPAAIFDVAQTLDCDEVFWNREYPLNEWRRDKAVEKRLAAEGVKFQSFDDRTLLPPGSIRNQTGDPYRVFTPFKRRYLQIIEESDGVEIFPAPEPQRPQDVEPGEVPDGLPGFETSVPDGLWQGGENAAQRALSEFAGQRLANYKKHRDVPALQGTAKISHHLAVGTLSPRQCLQAALQIRAMQPDASEGAECWISELIWRDFYQHLMFDFPRLSTHKPFQLQTDAIPWRESGKDFERWCAGQTGVPLVDAGMRQLVLTGWMHNRVRMVVAMFLTKNLLVDWRRGERFFMEHLVDGDFASNNGGWQWSASTGTDAAPYFRIFNPFSQAAKFDPEATYIKAFVPELSELDAAVIHNPDRLAARRPPNYPPVIVDLRASRQRAIDVFKTLG
ncbi:MAG: deoxyribodipyrimidine photo-lyase [bacterium]